MRGYEIVVGDIVKFVTCDLRLWRCDINFLLVLSVCL